MELDIAMPTKSVSDSFHGCWGDEKLTRSIERGAIFDPGSVPDGEDDDNCGGSLLDVCFREL